MNEMSFFDLCYQVIDFILLCFNAVWGQWYLRLLFTCGLIWLGFDIFQVFTDDEQDK